MQKCVLPQTLLTATPSSYTGLSVLWPAPGHFSRYTFYIYTSANLNPTEPLFQIVDDSGETYSFAMDGVTWIYVQDVTKARAVIYNPHPLIVFDWINVGVTGLGFGLAPESDTNILVEGVCFD